MVAMIYTPLRFALANKESQFCQKAAEGALATPLEEILGCPDPLQLNQILIPGRYVVGSTEVIPTLPWII